MKFNIFWTCHKSFLCLTIVCFNTVCKRSDGACTCCVRTVLIVVCNKLSHDFFSWHYNLKSSLAKATFFLNCILSQSGKCLFSIHFRYNRTHYSSGFFCSIISQVFLMIFLDIWFMIGVSYLRQSYIDFPSNNTDDIFINHNCLSF